MRLIIFAITCFLVVGFTHAQSRIPQVPGNVEIANVKLKITKEAQAIIQKDINALRASDRYFKVKLDRVNLYFPIIERVLKEAGVPDDIKYLSIQESALISDAVSTADAVGYWQFKDFTAREVGLRVDNKVDERKNITAATRGAAKYFNRNNFIFKNWIYAISAYQAGPGGASKYVNKSNFGSDKLTIDEKTHWYVLRFIAHVIAFRDEVGGKHSDGLQLAEYTQGGGKRLEDVAEKYKASESLVKDYNKWLQHGKIPEDREYVVIIPITGKVPKIKDEPLADAPLSRNTKAPEPVKYPDDFTANIPKSIHIRVNGLDAVMASSKDDINSLAEKTNLTVAQLEKFNDLFHGQAIKAGQVYYTQKKRRKSPIRFHVTQYGELLWDVSQRYGVQFKKLTKMNRLALGETIRAGQVLYLNKTRPEKTDVIYHDITRQLPSTDAEKAQIDSLDQVTKTIKDTFKSESAVGNSNNLKLESLDKPVSTPALILEENITDEDVPLKPHIVQPGESIWRISRTYGMMIDQLIYLNQIDPEASIQPGQKLMVHDVKPIEQPKPEKNTSGKTNSKTHVVQAGDTQWGISKKYGIKIKELQEWNDLNGQSILSPGMNLKVSDDSPQFQNHIVRGGDTLFQLSKKYNMTVSEIMDLNNLKSTDLSVGMELKVYR